MVKKPLLDVKDLAVSFATEQGTVYAVDGVSFQLARGEVLAIVGESGSGKSVSVSSIMGLTRGSGTKFSGQALLEGEDLISASDAELQQVRGVRVAMIFQDPMTSLNPVYRVGWQIAEQIKAHEQISNYDARLRTIELMKQVGIPQPDLRVDNYPHEFSGGMRQRAMIAMALSCSPDVLIADEPTTALDVTIQAQILELLRLLADERDAGVILVTHDLGVVAQVADRVAVMYAGRIVETGELDAIFYDPQHPYTWGLLGSIPRVDQATRRLVGIKGQLPSPLAVPPGCHFADRCPHRFDRCSMEPDLSARVPENPQHRDRCWLNVTDKRQRRIVAGQIGLKAGAKQ